VAGVRDRHDVDLRVGLAEIVGRGFGHDGTHPAADQHRGRGHLAPQREEVLGLEPGVGLDDGGLVAAREHLGAQRELALGPVRVEPAHLVGGGTALRLVQLGEELLAGGRVRAAVRA
jgi:hypothetical protein